MAGNGLVDDVRRARRHRPGGLPCGTTVKASTVVETVRCGPGRGRDLANVGDIDLRAIARGREVEADRGGDLHGRRPRLAAVHAATRVGVRAALVHRQGTRGTGSEDARPVGLERRESGGAAPLDGQGRLRHQQEQQRAGDHRRGAASGLRDRGRISVMDRVWGWAGAGSMVIRSVRHGHMSTTGRRPVDAIAMAPSR